MMLLTWTLNETTRHNRRCDNSSQIVYPGKTYTNQGPRRREMNENELRKYLDGKYPGIHLEVVGCHRNDPAALSMIGRIQFNFQCKVREPMGVVDKRLLESLGDTKRLIEDSIERVRINLGVAVVICGQQAVRVDGEYWIDAIGMEKLMDRVTDTSYCETIFYNSVPIIYKPILDAQGETK